MKRVLVMISLSLFPRLLAAQELDISPLIGRHWYGLYFNGEKVGYACNSVEVDDAGVVTVSENAQFQVLMANAKQRLEVSGKRTYAPEGGLLGFDQELIDPMGPKRFKGRVEGERLTVETTLGGNTTQSTFPKPEESLADALKQVALIHGGAKTGDELTFSLFEPMYQKEVTGVSRIVGREERIFEGAPTQVFKVQTTLPDLGVAIVSYVAENGTTLEDIIAGVIMMRLEPEEVAKDVDYTNDVIISNIVKVSQPIENPRGRNELHLDLKGPLTEQHLFNDGRQTMRTIENGFEFVGKRESLDGFEVAHLPIENPEATQWLKPSTFVQSDNPKLIEKAKEIAGDERNAAKVSELLCTWVNRNVRTTYSAQLSNALEVLDRLEGDCTEHSILFVGLARAAGLPAREVAGLVYSEGPPAGFYFHQWAKVWVGKWIDVDPTFDQPLADATHIKLSEGDLYQQTKLIPIIGQIRIEPAADASP